MNRGGGTSTSSTGSEDLFGRPIDLVEDSAIKNPYFRESVDETREPLYAA